MSFWIGLIKQQKNVNSYNSCNSWQKDCHEMTANKKAPIWKYPGFWL